MVSRIVKRIDSDYGDIRFWFGIVIKGDRAFIINSGLMFQKIVQQASSASSGGSVNSSFGTYFYNISFN
jgi:hypothetical protein